MNMKSLKDKVGSKVTKQNVKGFFRKQGLYVLIFLCLVAAGVTALVAWPRDDGNVQIGDPDSTVQSVDEYRFDDEEVSMIGAPTLEDELRELDEEINNRRPPNATPDPDTGITSGSAPVINNGSGSFKLTKPIEGQVINEFSGDSLVYFASLNVWATHNGIDIIAEQNADVSAALSGTIESVYTNEADGGVVVISHSNNAKTVYAGLSDISVNIGDKVSVGQKIGKVGELPKELDLSFHLHFEYLEGDTYKDPAKYF